MAIRRPIVILDDGSKSEVPNGDVLLAPGGLLIGGNSQPLATREESPIDGGIAVWNDTESRFDTQNLVGISGNFLTIDPTSGNIIDSGVSYQDIVNLDLSLQAFLPDKTRTSIVDIGDKIIDTVFQDNYEYGFDGVIWNITVKSVTGSNTRFQSILSLIHI